MRLTEVKISDAELGEVRTGFTGAKTTLEKRGGQYWMVWYSAKGQQKSKKQVKEGATYVVGPDFCKERPSVDEDTYWPRKWARIHQVPLNTFKIITDAKYTMYPWFKIVVGKSGSYWTWQDGLAIRHLVNAEWLKTASWEEFSSIMENPDRDAVQLQYIPSNLRPESEGFEYTSVLDSKIGWDAFHREFYEKLEREKRVNPNPPTDSGYSSGPKKFNPRLFDPLVTPTDPMVESEDED